MNLFSKALEGTDKRSAIAAIASITVVGMGLGLTGPLLSLLMEEQGYSSTMIGANTLMVGLASIASVPFITSAARKFGVVNLMIVNILCAVAMMLAFYLTTPLPDWFLVRFVFSVNMTVLFVLNLAKQNKLIRNNKNVPGSGISVA